MPDSETFRQRIVSSVFATKLVEESYVAHVKIWEEDASDEGGKKPRYIIISSMSSLLPDLLMCQHDLSTGSVQQWGGLHP